MINSDLVMSDKNTWRLPEPIEVREISVDDDTKIVLRRHGNPSGPRLVLSHGNGLAIDLYYPFWSLLADDFDLVLYDLRNHGWNSVGKLEDHNIPALVRDHEAIGHAIDDHFGEKPKIGVFHSVSGLTALLCPTKGSSYEARVLFDPPLCKPGRSYADFEEAADKTSRMVRQRAYRFRSPQELADILPYTPNFQRVVEGVSDLFAQTTLRKSDDDDTYVLRCPREFEAQIVEYAGIYAVLVDFETYVCPTKVIGADPLLPYSYLPTLELSDTVNVDYDFIPEATHFLQLEQPEECAATLREFIDPILSPD